MLISLLPPRENRWDLVSSIVILSFLSLLQACVPHHAPEVQNPRSPMGEASPQPWAQATFIAPHQPLKLLLTPDHRSLVVLEQGSLSVRNPLTLEVKRYLLPSVEGWNSLGMSQDGRVEATTLTSHHYRFDPVTWQPERLLTRPSPLVEDGLWTSRDGWPTWFQPDEGPRKLNVAEAGGWEFAQKYLHIPALPEGRVGDFVVSSPTRAEVFASDTQGNLYTLLPNTETPQAVSLEEPPGPLSFLKVSETEIIAVARGEVRIFDPKHHLLARQRLPDASLRLAFLPMPTSQNLPMPEPTVGKAYRIPLEPVPVPGARTLRDALYVPESQTLIWIADDFELGVTKLESGKVLARVPAVSDRVSSAFLQGKDGVAVLANGVLQRWSTSRGLQQWRDYGPYIEAVKLDDARILASMPDGRGRVVSATNGRILKTLCLAAAPCADPPVAKTARVSRPQAQNLTEDERQSREVNLVNLGRGYNTNAAMHAANLLHYGRLMRSPDGQYVVYYRPPGARRVLEEQDPSEEENGGESGSSTSTSKPIPRQEPVGAQLTVLDARSLNRLGTLTLKDVYRCSGRGSTSTPTFPSQHQVTFCGDQYPLPSLDRQKQPRPTPPQQLDSSRESEGQAEGGDTEMQEPDGEMPYEESYMEQFSGPPRAPRRVITPTGALVWLERGPQPLRTTFPEAPALPGLLDASALIDALQLPEAELRDSFVDFDPQSRRLLLSSGLDVQVGNSDLGSASVLNLMNWLLNIRPLQVWTVPENAPMRAQQHSLLEAPEPPQLPPDRFVDGIHEHARDEFPMLIRDVTVGPDALYLLGMSTLARGPYEESDGLWRLSIEGKIERIPLPSQDDYWLRTSVSAEGGLLWLLGLDHLCRLEKEGTWKTLTLRDAKPRWGRDDSGSITSMGLARQLLALKGGQVAVLRRIAPTPPEGAAFEQSARLEFKRQFPAVAASLTEAAMLQHPLFERVKSQILEEAESREPHPTIEVFGPEGLIAQRDIVELGYPITLQPMPDGFRVQGRKQNLLYRGGGWSVDDLPFPSTEQGQSYAVKSLGDGFVMSVKPGAKRGPLERARIVKISKKKEVSPLTLYEAPEAQGPTEWDGRPRPASLQLLGATSQRLHVLLSVLSKPEFLLVLDSEGRELERSVLRYPRWLRGLGVSGAGEATGFPQYEPTQDGQTLWMVPNSAMVGRYSQGEWHFWVNTQVRQVGMEAPERP